MKLKLEGSTDTDRSATLLSLKNMIKKKGNEVSRMSYTDNSIEFVTVAEMRKGNEELYCPHCGRKQGEPHAF